MGEWITSFFETKKIKTTTMNDANKEMVRLFMISSFRRW